MKRAYLLLLASCLLLSGCSGLPAAREMGDMALLRTVGIDAAPGGVIVTGSTGPRARGLQAEGEPALIVSAERESLSGACLAMQGQRDSYVFFGYVDQLLLGEDAEIQPALDYFARDVELSLGAQLWLVRGASAREAVASGGSEGVDSRLETLQTDSRLGVSGISRTAGEVCTDLAEWGTSFAPALTLSGEDGTLAEGGYGVLKDGILVGYLEGEEAKGLELLVGGPAADILEVELPDQEVSVRITSARTKSSLDFQGSALSALRLTCKVEARLSEYRTPLGSGELDRLREELENRELSRLKGALERLRGWEADCTGLGQKAAIAHPAQWQNIQTDWPERFAQVPVEVRVEVEIL